MKTSILGVVAALFAAAFILAACADDTGSTWTFAPTTASESEATTDPTEPETPEATEAPTEATAAPAESETPAEPEAPAPSGEARVIQMQADGALRFTDENGQPLADIPVTPGEVITFQIDNTAGFGHNFYIGTDQELSVPAATTDVGLPDWSTGVQELEWVVPEDIADLKFACTVPGHYYTMQGTFSQGEAAPTSETEPAATAAPAELEPAETAEPEAAADPAAAGEPRVIEFEADAAIRFMQEGEQMLDIGVTPGETVIFRIDNTAGFVHNFYIGPDEELQVPNGTTEVGVTDWQTGIMELEWVVPEDLSNLRFACTVPGHYYTMQGDFTISS